MVSGHAALVKLRKADAPPSPGGGLKVLYRKSQQGSGATLEADFFAERCERPGRPLIRGTNSATMHAALFRPDCGTWDCPHCGRKNVLRVKQIIAFGATAIGRIQPLQFVTLTSHERLATPEKTFGVLALAWNKLNRRYKRVPRIVGHAVYYLQIPEQHKSGRWHLHMLCSPPMPLRWWKDNARECGMGYECAVRELDEDDRAGRYMQKYLRKSLITDGTGWAKSMRRVRHSNNWPMSAQMKRKQSEWEWRTLGAHVNVEATIEQLKVSGYRVIVADSVNSLLDFQ